MDVNISKNSHVCSGFIQNYGNTGCGVFNCNQMKLLKFENWSSGELSKIGHDFRK